MKHVPETLKDALYFTIHRHPKLSVEAIAEQLDMTRSYLYRSALPDTDTDGPNASGVRFPLKKVVPLIRLTGDFQVLDHMEQQVGRVAIPLTAIDDNCETIQRKAVDAAADFGTLIQEVREALLDNKLSNNEKRTISKVGWVAIAAIMQVIKSCELE